jgi:opacity protein-like surface antigen
MKKLLFAATTLALATTGTAAFAADGEANFGGFYVGAQVSGTKLTDKHTDRDFWYYNLTNDGQSKTKAMVGVRGGYDFTSGLLLAGVLAEVNFGKITAAKEVTPQDPSYRIGTRIKMLGSVRARAGIASGKLAVTGNVGFAFNDSKQAYLETDGSDNFYSGKGKRTGWVVGASAAYAMTPHISLGLDFSHYQFGKKNHVILDGSGVAETGSDASDDLWHFTQKNNVDSVGVNVSYRF